MYSSSLAFITFAAYLPWSTLGAVHLHGRDLNAPLLDSYDYIVVGCGISGLVVTNRLSEDPSVNVLCIEAGDPDHYEPIIQDPVYVGADIGGIYDWDLSTTPQLQLDGATRPMPQGKVLGGGSILNAMCWNRGGQDDFNAWAALGNPGWDWEGMLPYFIKASQRLSETYTPVYSADIAREYSINYNPAVHGTSGPVQVSYPRYFYPQSTANLFAALNYLGVPTEFDPNDGSSAGAAFVPTDLDPNNQTRSDARRTYYDPYVSRPNFHVITGQHVTRIMIEGVSSNYAVSNPTPGGNEDGNGMNGMTSNNGFGFGPAGSTPALDNTTNARLFRRQSPSTSNIRITGVEFAASASDARRIITATREVIVAAGALHSAQLLQLSGIGPSSLLNTYGIPVALDLPGVGNNLQDHCLVGTFYPYNNASYPSPTQLTSNATYNAAAELEYNTYKTGPWTAGSPNALAFNPLPLISNNSESILSGANDQDPIAYLAGGLDPTILAGYTLQKQSLVRRLAETNVASYEIINNNAGSLTVAVMHPFSRGQCYIHSPDPFEPPTIDPRWLTNPVDRQILVEALLFNRQILATPAMLPLQAAQFVPPVDADEAAINMVINTGIRTEFHPSGTCAMLPLEQGGVVDPHLRVHGAQNLRVVDAGVFPMIPAAHLQAVVYAVAEKAADIIKADNVGVSTASPSSSSASASSLLASLTSSSGVSSISTSLTTSSSTVSLNLGNSSTTTRSLSSTLSSFVTSPASSSSSTASLAVSNSTSATSDTALTSSTFSLVSSTAASTSISLASTSSSSGLHSSSSLAQTSTGLSTSLTSTIASSSAPNSPEASSTVSSSGLLTSSTVLSQLPGFPSGSLVVIQYIKLVIYSVEWNEQWFADLIGNPPPFAPDILDLNIYEYWHYRYHILQSTKLVHLAKLLSPSNYLHLTKLVPSTIDIQFAINAVVLAAVNIHFAVLSLLQPAVDLFVTILHIERPTRVFSVARNIAESGRVKQCLQSVGKLCYRRLVSSVFIGRSAIDVEHSVCGCNGFRRSDNCRTGVYAP
ncbi:MAG: hypothetical protein Q9222_005818 [Ikaeria aurantiellina]